MRKMMTVMMLTVLTLLAACVAENYDKPAEQAEAIVEYSVVNHIYVATVGGPQRLEIGDTFLDLTLTGGRAVFGLDPNNGFAYIRTINGEFDRHVMAIAHFDGEIVVKGDLLMRMYEEQHQLFLFSLRIHEEYYELFPVLANHHWHSRRLDISNYENLLEMLGLDKDEVWGTRMEFENLTIRIRDFTLALAYRTHDSATIVEILQPERNAQFSRVNYIYVITADNPRGVPQRLEVGDSFLGLTLTSYGDWYGIADIMTFNGEFADHEWAAAQFDGEIAVSGNLVMVLYETQGGYPTIYFDIHELYWKYFPKLARPTPYEMMRQHFEALGRHPFWVRILNHEDLLDMLGLDKDEVWGTRLEFDNITIRINDFTLRAGYRAFDSATIVEILQPERNAQYSPHPLAIALKDYMAGNIEVWNTLYEFRISNEVRSAELVTLDDIGTIGVLLGIDDGVMSKVLLYIYNDELFYSLEGWSTHGAFGAGRYNRMMSSMHGHVHIYTLESGRRVISTSWNPYWYAGFLFNGQLVTEDEFNTLKESALARYGMDDGFCFWVDRDDQTAQILAMTINKE